jgi:hypothetical protein
MPNKLLFTLLFCVIVAFNGCKSLRLDSSVKILRGPNMPTGVYEMGYATDGKIIFSIGGTTVHGNYRQAIGETYLFSPFGGGWEKAHFTDKPLAKGSTRSAFLPNFNVLISAGFADVQKGNFYTFPMELLDMKDYRVEYIRNNPHWAQFSQIVYWNKKAYVFGGQVLEEDASTQFSDRLLSYDPATGEWEDLHPMPSPRATYAAVVGNSLYTFGGFDSEHSYADVWRYDFEGDYWETIGYLPYPVARFSVAVQYPYVFLSNVGEENNIIGRVDIRDGSFREFPTWITVSSPGSAIVGDHLYIFGGSWDNGRTASNKTFKIALDELMADE